jgi:hypothetical protein
MIIQPGYFDYVSEVRLLNILKNTYIMQSSNQP